jgi:hypothetical protein
VKRLRLQGHIEGRYGTVIIGTKVMPALRGLAFRFRFLRVVKAVVVIEILLALAVGTQSECLVACVLGYLSFHLHWLNECELLGGLVLPVN